MPGTLFCNSDIDLLVLGLVRRPEIRSAKSRCVTMIARRAFSDELLAFLWRRKLYWLIR